MDNYFKKLNDINVNDKTEKKNQLTYLSWAFAWAEIKKIFPDANYKIYENEQGWNYHTDGRTAWVKTGVTINGIEHIEYLPVMYYVKNSKGKNVITSVPIEKVTSFDVNKTIQRSLTKACARHGLGLYIYAGEDLPEEEKQEHSKQLENKIIKEDIVCTKCGAAIEGGISKDGHKYTAEEVAEKLGGLCSVCYMARTKA